MSIKPIELPVERLFQQNNTFAIPKYQRGYAWEEDSINDFIEDLSRCMKARAEGEKKSHFFGSVVTVPQPIDRSSRANFEVIDGQQRLASFVMLIAAVVRGMQGIVDDLDEREDISDTETDTKQFLEESITLLSSTYLIYRDRSLKMKYIDVPKLKLSDADDEFFQKIVAENKPTATRASHNRIQAAWDRLVIFVDDILSSQASAYEKTTILNALVNDVLATDCMVISMCTETRHEAYKIFQVLNDRGVHLTDGDLLRARTLERLDSKALSKIQSNLSDCWDCVLKYEPSQIDDYLSWYYSSVEGKRPISSSVADDFIEFRFGCKDEKVVTKDEAQAILNEVETIEEDFEKLQVLSGGEWPYENDSSVKTWDQERFRILASFTGSKSAMLPLLLSLSELKSVKFADAVLSLERFFFRFKVIGNQHITPATKIYLRHAKKIRDGDGYTTNELRKDLKDLIARTVPDDVFKAKLAAMQYSRSSNRNICHFITTLEDYTKWYKDGANGVPKCKDKMRVFDRQNTTIEHIYPKSADVKNVDKNLEKVKNDLGNLTILGPEDNNAAGNKSFADKRTFFEASSLRMNKDISKNIDWTADIVKQRTDKLVSMALKVFVP